MGEKEGQSEMLDDGKIRAPQGLWLQRRDEETDCSQRKTFMLDEEGTSLPAVNTCSK